MAKTNDELDRAGDIRLGRIVFTNVWPVFYAFPPADLAGRVQVATETPTRLNAALSSGDIDAASISSFAYAKHADELLLLPELSVGATGAVNSLFLFTKRPLEERLPERIALATTSATTVHLLKIIMAKRYEFEPEYVEMAPDLETMMNTCDAALLIGDDAIRAGWDASANAYRRYDLCTLWTEWTGYGMTFAVWAVREAWAEAHADDARTLHEALLASKRRGVALPEDLLEDAVRAIGGTKSYWRSYFGQLHYDFDERHRQGLELYFRLAHELGYLETNPPLRMWRYPLELQVNE